MKHLYRKYIKWPVQRLMYGYSDEIYCNLDSYLGDLIAYHLENFRDRCSGYPQSYKSEKAWKSDITIMAEAYRLLASDWKYGIENLNDPETVAKLKTIEKGTKLFRKHFNNLWI